MTILPTFKGYTVDERLKEFRKVPLNELPEFISFESEEGSKLLKEYRKEQGLKLITKDVVNRLPVLYSQEEVKDPMVICKFFYPDFSWTWYAIEYDGEDQFFGLVDGFEKELGYFSLMELLSNRGKLGMPIERDRFFKPCRLSELMHE